MEKMRIQDLGEETFIQRLREQFPAKGNIVGIGDDCAVIPNGMGSAWLVTTDILVEGVHFLREQIPPSEAGYKTVAVNVSDIAAKGGEPKYAFLSIAVPKDLECSWLSCLIQGIEDACAEWNILLLGGDTVSSKRDIFLSLTLIGTVIESHIKYRHQAKPGDVICVTGNLGDSGGGLKMLQQGIVPTQRTQKLIDAHFHPQPDPQQGMWLAAHPEVHAMMDISDGFNCDLKRMLTASKCGGIVDLAHLPISIPLQDVCTQTGWDAVEIGLVGGEDYCLLLTVSKAASEGIRNAFHEKFGSALYEIGQVTDQSGRLVYQKNGLPANVQLTDFEHFR